MKKLLLLVFSVHQFANSFAQDDLYRAVPWTPTYDSAYKVILKKENQLIEERSIDAEETSLNDLNHDLDNIARPKSYKIPQQLTKTEFKKFEHFIPPRPAGPPPNKHEIYKKFYLKNNRRHKRSLQDYTQSKTARVMKDVGISILAQGLGWLGWAALMTISNTNAPTFGGRGFSDEVNFEKIRDLPSFRNMIKQALSKSARFGTEDKTARVMRDVGISILAQGIGWLGWGALMTISNTNGPTVFGRSFPDEEVDLEALTDLPTFQNLVEKALIQYFSESEGTGRQASTGGRLGLADFGIFALVQDAVKDLKTGLFSS